MSMREKKSLFTVTPLYLRVRRHMVKKIAAGDYRVGDRLPSEVELAREMGVSEGTMRKALDSLEADFMLSRIQGQGTIIEATKPARPCPHCQGTGRVLPAPPPAETSLELPEEKAA